MVGHSVIPLVTLQSTERVVSDSFVQHYSGFLGEDLLPSFIHCVRSELLPLCILRFMSVSFSY